MKSIRQLTLVLSGTNAERLAINISSINPPCQFIESNGDVYDLTSTGWVKSKAGGAITVTSNVTVGTTLEIDAIVAGYSTTVGVGNRFFNTTTGNEGYWDGTQVVYDVTGGAAHIRPLFGPATQSRNRNMVSVKDAWTSAADNTRTWNVADNITELTIFPTLAGTGGPDAFVYCVLNAASDAIAQAWLDPTIDADSFDVQWYKLKIGEPTVIQTTAPITRIDFEVQSTGYTVDSADIWIGAN